jgi:hypothetical protein
VVLAKGLPPLEVVIHVVVQQDPVHAQSLPGLALIGRSVLRVHLTARKDPEPHRNVDIALLEGDPHHVSDRGRHPVARRHARERPHRLSVDTGYHDLEPAQLVGIVVVDDARPVDAAPGVDGGARLAGAGGGLDGQLLEERPGTLPSPLDGCVSELGGHDGHHRTPQPPGGQVASGDRERQMGGWPHHER